VVCDGTKIAGSAQRRSRGAIVEHGSVLLAQSEFAPELPGIRQLAGISIDPWELARRWSNALARRLSVELALDRGLTGSERQLARRQVGARFARSTWTRRR
jgi:lipoate-protein ligase A